MSKKKKASVSAPDEFGGTFKGYNYHPDYSRATNAEQAWNIYQSAINKYVDPGWKYGGGGQLYNPEASRGSLGAIADLAKMYGRTKAGQQIRSDITSKYLKNQQLTGVPALAEEKLKNRTNKALTKDIAAALGKEQKLGASSSNAVTELYNQLAYQHRLNAAKAAAKTPEVQLSAYHQTPQYQAQQALHQTYDPIIQQKAQGLIDAASIIQRYEELPSRARTPFLYSLGYTSLSDVYRGLTTYLPKDAPITPETLREAASALQSGPGAGQYIINDLLTQAKAKGRQINALGDMSTYLGTDLSKSNLSQLEALMALVQGGGALGVKKGYSRGGASSTQFQDPFKQ